MKHVRPLLVFGVSLALLSFGTPVRAADSHFCVDRVAELEDTTAIGHDS